ncbi:MAG: DUF5916 domain-containing protein [Flavobacteriaceae bacterium]
MSSITYDDLLFTLKEDGILTTEDNIHIADINNLISILIPGIWIFRYTWQFAPGSQLTTLYRNSLFNSNSDSTSIILKVLIPCSSNLWSMFFH